MRLLSQSFPATSIVSVSPELFNQQVEGPEPFEIEMLACRHFARVHGVRSNEHFMRMARYLAGFNSWQDVESFYRLVPSDLRALRKLKTYLSFVKDQGRKAPKAFSMHNLNTGESVLFMNTSWPSWNLIPYKWCEPSMTMSEIEREKSRWHLGDSKQTPLEVANSCAEFVRTLCNDSISMEMFQKILGRPVQE